MIHSNQGDALHTLKSMCDRIIVLNLKKEKNIVKRTNFSAHSHLQQQQTPRIQRWKKSEQKRRQKEQERK